MRYGLYGEKPDEESEIWDFGFDGIIATISSAKEKYQKKFNIPKEELGALLSSGRTQQQIAEYYGCSVDTVQRRMKDYGLSRTARNTAESRFATRSELPLSCCITSSGDTSRRLSLSLLGGVS